MSAAARLASTASEAARFAVVGGLNTLAGLGVILGGKLFLGLGDIVANALGYAVGLLVSFTLNRRWTFGLAGPAGAAAIRFLAAFGIAYAANLASVLALIEWAGTDSYLAQCAGALLYAAVFFALSKLVVFRPDPRRRQ